MEGITALGATFRDEVTALGNYVVYEKGDDGKEWTIRILKKRSSWLRFISSIRCSIRKEIQRGRELTCSIKPFW